MVALALKLNVPHKRRIINHDIMNCTAEGVPGNHLYSGRALGITDPNDIIQLHPDLRPQWPAIAAHYKNVGLKPSSNIIWDVKFNLPKKYSHYEPSVFFFSEEQQHFCRNDNWYHVVQYINSKNNFMALAEELKLDIPSTLCFSSIQKITNETIQRLPYPCYLKAAESVAGVGIYRCAEQAELRAALSYFKPNVPVQVQEEVNTNIFLNLQYRVSGHRLEKLATTEQLLNGFTHQGNRSPASFTPWRSVNSMAEWLFSHGMKGVFAFDVAVVNQGENLRFLPIECNPRFNGATYPTLIAEKLGVTNWLARTCTTTKRRLSDIDLTGIEYNPSLRTGVIIVNWGPILVGKLLCMFVGIPEVQRHLQSELQKRLE